MSEHITEIHQFTNGKLLSDLRFQSIFTNYVAHVRGNDRQGLPRYGLLTITARRTPFFLYDHPAILNVANTAFTEGSSVFMSTPLFSALLDEEKTNDTKTASIVPVLLHELKHKLMMHVYRMGKLNSQEKTQIMNIAQDIFINMRLKEGFKEQYTLGPFWQQVWGVTEREKELYFTLTEEQIFAAIMRDAKKAEQKYNEGYEAGKEGKPISKAEQDDSHHPKIDPNEAKKEGYKDGKNGKPNKMDAPKGEKHTLTPGELRKELEKNGLKDVADKLKLPQPGDQKAQDEKHKSERQRVQEDMAQAKAIRQKGGNMAGAHIEDAMETEIKSLYEPKLNWSIALRQIIMGDGQHLSYNEAIPDPVYYLDPDALGVPDALYEGMVLPSENQAVVAIVIDTSGSVDDDMLKAFFSEAFGMVKEDPLNSPHIRIYSADTALRGKPLDVTPDNWEEKLEELKAYGRGGTTFEEPMNAVFDDVASTGKPMAGMVYFTDTYAAPPKRNRLPEQLPPLVFIADETNAHVESFKNEIAPFADLYAIKGALHEDNTIELGR